MTSWLELKWCAACDLSLPAGQRLDLGGKDLGGSVGIADPENNFSEAFSAQEKSKAKG